MSVDFLVIMPVLLQFPNGAVAVVSDSYDIW